MKDFEEVKCPYSIPFQNSDMFVCLQNEFFVNCSGKAVKVAEEVNASRRLMVRKARLKFKCPVLNEDLSFSNIPETKFEGSLYNVAQGNCLVDVNEVEKRIIDRFASGETNRERAVGQLLILKKWPLPLKDAYQISSFGRYFIAEVGELFLEDKLSLLRSVRNSIREKLSLEM